MNADSRRSRALQAWTKFFHGSDAEARTGLTRIASHPAPHEALRWFFLWLLLDSRHGARGRVAGTPLEAAVDAASLFNWKELLERDAAPHRSTVLELVDEAPMGRDRSSFLATVVYYTVHDDPGAAAWASRAASRSQLNVVFGTPLDEPARLACERAQKRALDAILTSTAEDGPWPAALASAEDEAATAAMFADWLAERGDERAALVREVIKLLAPAPRV